MFNLSSSAPGMDPTAELFNFTAYDRYGMVFLTLLLRRAIFLAMLHKSTSLDTHLTYSLFVKR